MHRDIYCIFICINIVVKSVVCTYACIYTMRYWGIYLILTTAGRREHIGCR
jgi:hypothetical protein